MAGDDVMAAIIDAARVAAAAEGLTAPAAKRIGAAICDRLQADFGTSRVYVPARSSASRDRAILAAVAAGESRSTIAARVGVHVTTVDRVARRYSQQPTGLG